MIKLKDLISEGSHPNLDPVSSVWGIPWPRHDNWQQPAWAKAAMKSIQDRKTLKPAWEGHKEWLTGGEDYHDWAKSTKEGRDFRKASLTYMRENGDPRKIEALLLKYANLDVLQNEFNVPRNHIHRLAKFIAYWPLAFG